MSQEVAGGCISWDPDTPHVWFQTEEPYVRWTSPRSTAPSCRTRLSGCPLTPDQESTSPCATPTPSSFISSCFFLWLALVALRNWVQTICCLTGQCHHCVWPPCHAHFLRGEVRPVMWARGPGGQHQPITSLRTPFSPPLLGNKHPRRLELGAPHRGRRSHLYLGVGLSK